MRTLAEHRRAIPGGSTLAVALVAWLLAGCSRSGTEPDAGRNPAEPGKQADAAPGAGTRAGSEATGVKVGLATGDTAQAASGETGGSPPSGVAAGTWVEVRRETIRKVHPAIGMLQARQTTRLGPQVSGRVQEVLVDVGDAVTLGQDLVKIDPVFFEIDVSLRKADLEVARVALADAELNFRRMRNLWEKPRGEEPSIPQKVYDEAKNKNQAGELRVKQAEETLRDAEKRLDECTVRAPYDGVITRRLVDAGEPVTSTPVTHLLEIEQVDVLELEFSLPQYMLSRVNQGTPVTFEVEGLTAGTGTIALVFPSLEEATRTFRCRVLVDNRDRRFRPGVLVRVQVTEDEVLDALVVPRAALLRAATGWEVIALVGPKTEQRSVQVGIDEGRLVQVIGGVQDGDKVFVPGEVTP